MRGEESGQVRREMRGRARGEARKGERGRGTDVFKVKGVEGVLVNDKGRDHDTLWIKPDPLIGSLSSVSFVYSNLQVRGFAAFTSCSQLPGVHRCRLAGMRIMKSNQFAFYIFFLND